MHDDGLSYCILTLVCSQNPDIKQDLTFQIGSSKNARSYFHHLKAYLNGHERLNLPIVSARAAIRQKRSFAEKLSSAAHALGVTLSTRVAVGTSMHDLTELYREVWHLNPKTELRGPANDFIRQFRRILRDEYACQSRGGADLAHAIPLDFAPRLDLELRDEDLEMFSLNVPYGSWCLSYDGFAKSILDAYLDNDVAAIREGRMLARPISMRSCSAVGWFAERNFSTFYQCLRAWWQENALAGHGYDIEDKSAVLGLMPIAFWVPTQQYRDKTHEEMLRILGPFDVIESCRFTM